MAVTFKELINAQITDASGAIAYTGATGVRTRVLSASICNTSSTTPYTVNVYKIPSGGSAGASTKIVNTRTIHPNETYTCPELIGQILEAGDKLDADASTTLVLNFIVSGVEI